MIGRKANSEDTVFALTRSYCEAAQVDLGVEWTLGADLSKFRDLNRIPDWPRIRKLLAQRLGKSEDEIQAMAESADSLNVVELVMAIEEGLGIRIDRYPQS